MTESMFDVYRLDLTLLQPLLGTLPKDRAVLEAHVQNQERKQSDEKLPPVDPEEKELRSWTTFYVDDEGRPVLLDYQVKGALKEAANTIKDVVGVKNLRSHVENTVFVQPRVTVLADAPEGSLERPLRAMTPQGPRVTVVRSDLINAGHSYVFGLKVLKGSKVTREVLERVCEYMAYKGLGQWRNGGYGRCDAVVSRVGE